MIIRWQCAIVYIERSIVFTNGVRADKRFHWYSNHLHAGKKHAFRWCVNVKLLPVPELRTRACERVQTHTCKTPHRKIVLRGLSLTAHCTVYTSRGMSRVCNYKRIFITSLRFRIFSKEPWIPNTDTAGNRIDRALGRRIVAVAAYAQSMGISEFCGHRTRQAACFGRR